MRDAVHGKGVEADLFFHDLATFNALSRGLPAARTL
jgi:hypothetical protein